MLIAPIPALRSRLHRAFGHRERLHAIDGALHVGIQILDADARPRDARFGERCDRLVGQSARIDFHCELSVLRDRKPAAELALKLRMSAGDSRVGEPPPQ